MTKIQAARLAFEEGVAQGYTEADLPDLIGLVRELFGQLDVPTEEPAHERHPDILPFLS